MLTDNVAALAQLTERKAVTADRLIAGMNILVSERGVLAQIRAIYKPLRIILHIRGLKTFNVCQFLPS